MHASIYNILMQIFLKVIEISLTLQATQQWMLMLDVLHNTLRTYVTWITYHRYAVTQITDRRQASRICGDTWVG